MSIPRRKSDGWCCSGHQNLKPTQTATRRNTLQHTATLCNTLQPTGLKEYLSRGANLMDGAIVGIGIFEFSGVLVLFLCFLDASREFVPVDNYVVTCESLTHTHEHTRTALTHTHTITRALHHTATHCNSGALPV